jgi:CelD/BcsL family acetyltransferase involved in cellulose biosynthesis
MGNLHLEPIDDLEHASADWARLAERSGNIFSTWEWASIWWDCFGAGRELLLTACRDADRRLVAILPLYLSSKRPVRTIRFLGHGPADQLGPVCDPADHASVAEALKRALAVRYPRWDLFIGDHLPADEDWSALLGGPTLLRAPSPVVRIGGRSWDDFLASRSSNFRGQVGRRERKLAREHELRYRLADDPTRLQDDVDTLFELHAAQYNEAFTGALADFHREFARCALERGWLRLWLMEVNARPVAAWYGFRFCGAECYYQAGRDPAWDGYSVGFVLLAHSIREAFNDGMREYRLLLGGESYKERFATEDPGIQRVGLARTLAGRASIAAAITTRSMPRPVKRLFTRMGG